jgi:hypothetical protein
LIEAKGVVSFMNVVVAGAGAFVFPDVVFWAWAPFLAKMPQPANKPVIGMIDLANRRGDLRIASLVG